MTESEFVKWMAGFCEAIGDDSPPNLGQWKRLVRKVRSVSKPDLSWVDDINANAKKGAK